MNFRCHFYETRYNIYRNLRIRNLIVNEVYRLQNFVTILKEPVLHGIETPVFICLHNLNFKRDLLSEILNK